MSVLVIAAHPDDEILGCGGVMARHLAQGESVHVLIVTRGIPDLFPPEQVEKVRAEMKEALAVIGVTSVKALDFPAPELDIVARRQLAGAIGRVIRELRAAIVYIPHYGDIHADHEAVYQAALVASRPINHCPVKRLLCYETLSETEWASPFGNHTFIPTVFIDVADYLDIKLEAMRRYGSQLKEAPHPRSLRSIQALAELRGGTVGLVAAEAFALVREIAD